jgi:hypothetical protein
LVRGKQVRCEGDKRDRYGRPLVHCWIGPVDLGRQMVQLGWELAEFRDEYRGGRSSRPVHQDWGVGGIVPTAQGVARDPPLVELYYL